MAFQIQRKQKINEVLELQDECGKVMHSLDISLDVDKLAPRLYKAKKELAESQQNYAVMQTDEAMERYGESIVKLFCAIFGEENTNTIVSFYESRYTEMLIDIFPFITEVIYPRINAIEEQKVAQIKDMRKRFK